jgi:hypothetical protein
MAFPSRRANELRTGSGSVQRAIIRAPAAATSELDASAPQ